MLAVGGRHLVKSPTSKLAKTATSSTSSMDSPPPTSPEMRFQQTDSVAQDDIAKSTSPETSEKSQFQGQDVNFGPERKIMPRSYHMGPHQGPFHVGRLLPDKCAAYDSDEELENTQECSDTSVDKTEDGEPSRKKRKQTPKQNRNGFNFESNTYEAEDAADENEGKRLNVYCPTQLLKMRRGKFNLWPIQIILVITDLV